MKLVKNYAGQLYAVGVATGKSAEGVEYQNVLISSENKSSIRSPYSIFLDVNDKEMLKTLGIKDIEDFRDKDGARKVTPITPVALMEGSLYTVQHAPYGVNVVGKPKPRIIRSTSIVVRGEQSASAVAEDALQRAFDRADFLAKNPEYYAEYKKFVLFLASREEFEDILQDFDKPEE